MTTTPQGSSEGVSIAQRIQRTFITVMNAPPAEMMAAFKQLQGELLAAHPEAPWPQEVPRRIAECQFNLLSGSDAPDEWVTAQWARLEALGFSSMERRASMSFYLANHEKSRGRRGAVFASAIQGLADCVQHFEQLGDTRQAEHFTRVIARLQAEPGAPA